MNLLKELISLSEKTIKAYIGLVFIAIGIVIAFLNPTLFLFALLTTLLGLHILDKTFKWQLSKIFIGVLR